MTDPYIAKLLEMQNRILAAANQAALIDPKAIIKRETNHD